MRTKVPVILLSVLALLFHACGGKDTQDKQELSVSTSQVTALPQNGNKEFPFIARPFRTSELSFRVGGPIDHFDVYAGNRYEQGNIIAEIDPRDFRIRKERAEAVYRQSKAEFERIEALYRKENISASTYEKAKADYISAKTAFDTAVCELEDTRLTAPFTGYVGEVYIEKFQDVKATQPVVSLIDIHQLRIEIYVPQEIAYAAQSSDSIRICFDAIPGQTYRAKVIEVSKGTTRDLVDLELGVELAALLQDLAGLVGGDGIHAAAKGHQLHQIHILLGGAVLGGGIQAVVGPLVQHAGGELLHPVGDAVLGNNGSAVAGDKAVDAVVHLGVHMVGAACQHDDALALTAGFIDDLAALHRYLPCETRIPHRRHPLQPAPLFQRCRRSTWAGCSLPSCAQSPWDGGCPHSHK